MSLHAIIYSLKSMLEPHFEELKELNFTFANPVFWIFMILLFVLVTRFWNGKKGFSFTLMISAMLLLTTKMEAMTEAWLLSRGEGFDPLPVRTIAFFVMMMVFFYYTLIRE
ncbi:hypothetical protein ACFL5X_00760 [Candidatus Omnitrophota bacterium]